jgi:hypothetical protein
MRGPRPLTSVSSTNHGSSPLRSDGPVADLGRPRHVAAFLDDPAEGHLRAPDIRGPGGRRVARRDEHRPPLSLGLAGCTPTHHDCLCTGGGRMVRHGSRAGPLSVVAVVALITGCTGNIRTHLRPGSAPLTPVRRTRQCRARQDAIRPHPSPQRRLWARKYEVQGTTPLSTV